MAEIVEMFVSEMPERIRTLRTALDSRSWDQLRRVGHQLRGAGAGYGFSVITTEAARLEDAIKSMDPASLEGQISDVQALAEALIRLCERVRA